MKDKEFLKFVNGPQLKKMRGDHIPQIHQSRNTGLHLLMRWLQDSQLVYFLQIHHEGALDIPKLAKVRLL